VILVPYRSKAAVDLAQKRLRELLARNQPRRLELGMEKKMPGYLAVVRQRTMAGFQAAK
jgi:hypothetical protein